MIRRWWAMYSPATHLMILPASVLGFMACAGAYADNHKADFSFWHPLIGLCIALGTVFVYGIAYAVGHPDCWDCKRNLEEVERLRAALKETR